MDKHIPSCILGSELWQHISHDILLMDGFRDDYSEFADFCFKEFGDRVKKWVTINEPSIFSTHGYQNGINAPGRCSPPFGNCTAGDSTREPYIVAHNLLLAHSRAVKIYRSKYQVRIEAVLFLSIYFHLFLLSVNIGEKALIEFSFFVENIYLMDHLTILIFNYLIKLLPSLIDCILVFLYRESKEGLLVSPCTLTGICRFLLRRRMWMPLSGF